MTQKQVKDEVDHTPKVSVSILSELKEAVIGILVSCILAKLFTKPLDDSFLWITSPSGETTRQLPFYTALRIVRKHNWHLTDVMPRRTVTRRIALKILLFGDRQ